MMDQRLIDDVLHLIELEVGHVSQIARINIERAIWRVAEAADNYGTDTFYFPMKGDE